MTTIMNINNLHNEGEKAQSYAPPVSQEIIIKVEGMICTSPTEKVGETDGEW